MINRVYNFILSLFIRQLFLVYDTGSLCKIPNCLDMIARDDSQGNVSGFFQHVRLCYLIEVSPDKPDQLLSVRTERVVKPDKGLESQIGRQGIPGLAATLR